MTGENKGKERKKKKKRKQIYPVSIFGLMGSHILTHLI